MAKNRVYKRLLLGLGFDCEDGHVRITKGSNFRLFGGSDQTHEMMREKAVRFNEVLSKKGKTLETLKIKEFYDIAHKIGLKVPKKMDTDKHKGGDTNGKSNG